MRRPAERVVLTCFYCGESFSRKKSRPIGGKTYCSKECFLKDSSMVTITCSFCGKEFSRHITKLNINNNYCSKKCMYSRVIDNGGKVTLVCNTCGKEYVTFKCWLRKDRELRYCSKKCAGIGRSLTYVGENSPRWKGGITTRIGEHAWRKAVIERDGHQCVECGAVENLQAHHIEEWSKDKDKRYNIDNGITLCINCHANIHPNRKSFMLGGHKWLKEKHGRLGEKNGEMEARTTKA